MSTYFVDAVRRASSDANGFHHRHIVGVFPVGHSVPLSNQQVADSIRAGNEWYTFVQGEPKAKIEVIGFCPKPSCLYKPYLRTDADASKKNNLENLPEK